jgi:DNA repair photolyase
MNDDTVAEMSWGLVPDEMVSIAPNLAVNKEIFGALSQESSNPLSRISVANSSFSLDPFRGCPANCAYCTVAGALRDITLEPINDIETRILLPKTPERLFPGTMLAEHVMEHPAFIKDRSIISIGTGSTEAFLPQVEEDTWDIMKTLLHRGYRNPFWIVTKLGIADRLTEKWLRRFQTLSEQKIQVLVSVTFSAAPTWVEAYQGPRFRNMELLKNVGVKISHHLRPVIPGVNDSDECLQKAVDAASGIAEAICLGGLRRDQGVDVAWSNVYGLNPQILPERQNSRSKDLSHDYSRRVKEYVLAKKLDIPVYHKSSEVISYLLGFPDYNLYKYRPNDERCLISIPLDIQASILETHKAPPITLIEQVAQSICLKNVVFFLDGTEVKTSRKLLYQEHRALIHAIGHSGILP